MQEVDNDWYYEPVERGCLGEDDDWDPRDDEEPDDDDEETPAHDYQMSLHI